MANFISEMFRRTNFFFSAARNLFRGLSAKRFNSTTTSPTSEAVEDLLALARDTPAEKSSKSSSINSDNDDDFHFLKEDPQVTKSLNRQIIEILFDEPASNDLNKKLKENKALRKELASFINDFASTKILEPKKKIVEKGPNRDFPFLIPSHKTEPYTSQELHLRREFFGSQASKLGSLLKDVYIPHQEVFYPKTIKNVTVSKLLAAGAHLGHSTSLYRPSNQPYILGSYKGLHIIDLDQTLIHLRTAAKVVEGVAERGGIILFIGTRENLQRPLEIAAERCGGYYVASRWVPGTITNCTEISTWDRQEVDFEDKPTGKVLDADEVRSLVKPDLVVILNPVENRVAVRECIQSRIPTIGVIDTDSESSLVTYPIPANDDSVRCLTLLIGVLSKAGESGKLKRYKKIQDYKTKNQDLIQQVKEDSENAGLIEEEKESVSQQA